MAKARADNLGESFHDFVTRLGADCVGHTQTGRVTALPTPEQCPECGASRGQLEGVDGKKCWRCGVCNHHWEVAPSF